MKVGKVVDLVLLEDDPTGVQRTALSRSGRNQTWLAEVRFSAGTP